MDGVGWGWRWGGGGDGVRMGCGWAVRDWECLLSAIKVNYYVCFDAVLRYIKGMTQFIINWNSKENNRT